MMNLTARFELDQAVFFLTPTTSTPTTIAEGVVTRVTVVAASGALPIEAYQVTLTGTSTVVAVPARRIFRERADAQYILDVIG